MFPMLTDEDAKLHDQIVRQVDCPHFSMGMIDARWSFFYSDPATGIHDYKITRLKTLEDRPQYHWVSAGREFARQYYTYRTPPAPGIPKRYYGIPLKLDVIVNQDDVVHHIHMTSPAEMSSFEAFAVMWYRGAPKLETTNVPYAYRTRHHCLWDFFDAVGWDHKKKQFPRPSSAIAWPEPTRARSSTAR